MPLTIVDAQGTVVKITNGSAALVVVGGVQSISGLGSGSRTERDRTTLASTDKEFGFGLKDNGTFTLNALYSPDDVGQTELLAMHRASSAVAREFEITLENSEVRTFDAYVTAAPNELGADSDTTVSYECRITGAIVYS